VLGGEDCLVLTVYTPHRSVSPTTPDSPPRAGEAPLPVMVWIPGGGFVVGGASREDWDPEFFMDQVIGGGSELGTI
jgi:carboxylesterase type B